MAAAAAAAVVRGTGRTAWPGGRARVTMDHAAAAGGGSLNALFVGRARGRDAATGAPIEGGGEGNSDGEGGVDEDGEGEGEGDGEGDGDEVGGEAAETFQAEVARQLAAQNARAGTRYR